MSRTLDPARLDCQGKKRESWENVVWRACGRPSRWWWPWVGSELTDDTPWSEETHLRGSGVENGTGERTSAQQRLEKEPCGGQEKGQGKMCVLEDAESASLCL